MSALNIFNKEIECDLCGIKIRKSQAFGFDSTIRGKRHEGKKLKLCKSCFLDKIRQAIQEYEGKAVFYYPLKEDNAYHYYEFNEDSRKELADEDYDNNTFPPFSSFKLIPRDGEKCKCCGNDAQYSWCKSEVMEDIDTFNLIDFPNESIKVEYLCADCLIKKFTDAIQEDNLIIKEFFPPVDNEGIGISGEC